MGATFEIDEEAGRVRFYYFGLEAGYMTFAHLSSRAVIDGLMGTSNRCIHLAALEVSDRLKERGLIQ